MPAPRTNSETQSRTENPSRRLDYLPIALEARILLARAAGAPSDQRRQLTAMAKEALVHGRKQLAEEAIKR